MVLYSTIYDDFGRINLVREGINWRGRTSEKYSTSEDICFFCCDYLHMDRLTEEQVYVFCFNH